VVSIAATCPDFSLSLHSPYTAMSAWLIVRGRPGHAEGKRHAIVVNKHKPCRLDVLNSGTTLRCRVCAQVK
jgi:hypothetical protein